MLLPQSVTSMKNVAATKGNQAKQDSFSQARTNASFPKIHGLRGMRSVYPKQIGFLSTRRSNHGNSLVVQWPGNSVLPLHGAQVRFLVGELRYHKSHSSVKKEKEQSSISTTVVISLTRYIPTEEKGIWRQLIHMGHWSSLSSFITSHNCDSSELTYMFQFCNKIKNSRFTYQFICGCDVLHFYLLTYFWLCWVLVAAHGLLTAVGASLPMEPRLQVLWLHHCSSQGLECGHSTCGTRTQLCLRMRDLGSLTKD